MSTTFAELLGAHNIIVPDETLAELSIPVLAGPQRQGDVGIFPRSAVSDAELSQMTEIPPAGIQVVRGEATGNTHLLHPSGRCWWRPVTSQAGSVLLGVLHVEEGAECFLIHTDEHGANGIAPGSYEIRGKREMAEEIRRVED